MCLICVIRGEEIVQRRIEHMLPDDVSNADTINGITRDQQPVYYFAIGSMTNPVALALRNLVPISSQPAKLESWYLRFLGIGGMASAEPDNDASDSECERTGCNNNGKSMAIHGVLHLLTATDMRELDRIEGGYARRPCLVTPYNFNRNNQSQPETTISAFVYQMLPPPSGDRMPGTPTQRYLDIIATGCKHFGVSGHWIDWLQSQVSLPRKPEAEWASFLVNTSTTPRLQWSEIRRHRGSKEITSTSSSLTVMKDLEDRLLTDRFVDQKVAESSLYIVINDKVLEFIGDPTSAFYRYFVGHDIGGTDFTLRFARGYYEPIFSFDASISSVKDMTPAHRQWVEDQFATPPAALAPSVWRLVGLVDDEPEIEIEIDIDIDIDIDIEVEKNKTLCSLCSLERPENTIKLIK